MMKPRLLLLAAGMAAALAASGKTHAQAEQKPANVVLIMVDDLGFEALQCYGGGSYETPHLNKLASEGVRFTNCHATPLCTPSRVRVMTGKYSFRNFEHFTYLNSDETTFADIARQQGYATCVAGKWQLSKGANGKEPNGYGFDDYCVWYLKDRTGGRYADPTISTKGTKEKVYQGQYGPDIFSDFICDFIEENKEGPFFAYYPMVLTHDPFVPTPDSEGGLYAKPPKGSKQRERQQGEFDITKVKGSAFQQQCFADMIAYTDKIVGKIIAKLEALNLRENTLVIFTSDNGSHPTSRTILDGKEWQGGKGRIHEFGTHVPLLVQWKGSIAGGGVCEDLIDFTDIFPTIAETINAPLSADNPINGISFMPQLLGVKGSPRDHLFLHYDPSHGKPGTIWGCALTRFIRTEKWKLYNDGRLYDIVKDRTEQKAVPADAYPEVRLELQKFLDAQPDIDTAVTPSVKRGTAMKGAAKTGTEAPRKRRRPKKASDDN